MKIDLANLSKTIILYTVALTLGIYSILEQDLVIEPQPSVLGYLIVSVAVSTLGWRLFVIIKNRRR